MLKTMFNPDSSGKKIVLILLAMLFTASLAFGAALNEGFEGTTFPPDGWSEGSGWSRSTSYSHTGSASAKCSWSSGSYWLITPQLDVSTSDTLKYWIRRYYSGYSNDWFKIEISTTTNDISSFSAVDSFHTDALSYTFEEKKVSLDSYAKAKGTIYIAFHYVSTGGPNIYIDDVSGPELYAAAHDFATLDHATDSRSMQDTTVLVNENVTFHIVAKNWGTTTESSPIKWTCTGGSPTSDTDENTASLAQDATEHHTFSPTWSASTAGTYTVKFYTDLATDTDHSNDTTTVVITVCAPITSFPWTEGFEGGSIPDCWTNLNDLWTIGSESHSGSYCARVSYYHTGEAILTTPPINLPANHRIKFWWKDDDISSKGGKVAGHDTTYFEISTDGGSSWTTLDTLSAPSSMSNYEEAVHDLSSYAGNGVYVRWRDVTDATYNAYGTGLDDITIEEIPQVPIIDLSDETHDFGLIEAGSSVNWDVTIYNNGGANLNVTGSTVSAPFSCSYTGTIPPNGSAPATITFHPTTAGSYSETLTFHSNATSVDSTIDLTGKAYAQGALYESFEGTTFPPDGWTSESHGTYSAPWSRSSSESHSGTYSAKGAYSYSGYTNEWLITPRLNIATGDSITFWRDFAPGSSSYPDTLEILVSDDGMSTWHQLAIATPDSADDGGFVYRAYSLDSYTGNNGYVAFRYASNNGYSSYIDDVLGPTLFVGPPGAPTNPNPGNGDTGVSNTADLSWTNGYQTDNIDLYFSTDSSKVATKDASVRVITGQDTSQYDPGTMAYNTKHFWRVVAHNSAKATTDGPLWKFTTEWDPNHGGGGDGTGGYYFANSLATDAPSHPSYSWIDTTGHTVVPIDPDMTGNKDGYLSDDDYEGPFNIGFSFPFFTGTKGGTFTQFYIQSNGLISFTDAEISPSNDPIPVDGDETDFIAWCWDDMDADDPDVTDTDVRYYSGTDKCVITFWHYPEYGASAGEYVTAQVILYPSGNIKIQYNDAESDIPGTADYPNDCTIGIEGDISATANGIEYRYNGTGGPMFGSDLAVMFGENENTLPVELIAGSLIAEYAVNEYGSEYVVISWATASETDVNGFNIWRNTENNFSTAIQVNPDLIEGHGTTSETHNYTYNDESIMEEELHAGDIYYYWLEVVDLGGTSSYSDAFEFVAPDNYEPPVPPELPLKIGLYQNCPNPFNPALAKTKICFYLGEGTNANVEIKIYNIKGELVKTIWNQYTEFEKHPVPTVWDGCDENGKVQANGIYFYQLKTDNFNEIKKMLVIR
ncbi:MAG: choice-of-anchor J domain-containing protein [Armatimonadetes bacterium]|nr:choice-of-anchor J domain-containing protein [Armatimonadota bacterium]